MTYKFTESAKKAIEYANEITIELGHEYIGTEHILYGLAKESTGIASKVLEGQGATVEKILSQIEELIGPRKTKSKKNIRIYTKNKKGIRKCIIRSKKNGLRIYGNRTYTSSEY